MTEKSSKGKFEKDLEKLESLMKKIEGGELSLEDTIARFEEGLGLIKTCRTFLDGAELRINKLVTDSDKKGTEAVTEPFAPKE